MTDALAIGGLIQSFKTMADLGKALLGMRDAVLIQNKVAELNGEILSAQASALATQMDQFTLLEQKRALEEEVARLKAWDAEKQKYQLAKLNPHTDVFAYTLKQDSGVTEPPHSLCPQCYQDGVKTILQKEIRLPLAEVLVCNRCGSELYIMGRRHPEHAATKRAPRRPR